METTSIPLKLNNSNNEILVSYLGAVNQLSDSSFDNIDALSKQKIINDINFSAKCFRADFEGLFVFFK